MPPVRSVNVERTQVYLPPGTRGERQEVSDRLQGLLPGGPD
jgi:hypothetical protein